MTRVYIFITVAMMTIVFALSILGALYRDYPAIIAFKAWVVCMHHDGDVRARCYEGFIPDLVLRTPVERVFEAIRVLQRVDTAALDCHYVAHRMGEILTAADPKNYPAIFQQESIDGLCAFGFSHGTAIRAFKRESLSSPAEVEVELERVRGVCVNDLARVSFRIPQMCYHNVGHLLYYLADQDMPTAFTYCDALVPYDEGAQEHCYTGVGMIALVRDDYDKHSLASTIEKREVTRAACYALQKDGYIAGCLRGRWPLYADEILDGSGIDEFCADQPGKEETLLCYRKLYVSLGWRFVQEPARVHEGCSAIRADLHLPCHRVAAQEIIDEGGGRKSSIWRGIALCRFLEQPKDEHACIDALVQDAARRFVDDQAAGYAYCRAFPGNYRASCFSVVGSR